MTGHCRFILLLLLCPCSTLGCQRAASSNRSLPVNEPHFVEIPAGRYRYFVDGKKVFPVDNVQREGTVAIDVALTTFTVSNVPLTMGEYLEYVNDMKLSIDDAFAHLAYGINDFGYDNGRIVLIGSIKGDHPARNIPWKRAIAYCKWKSDDKYLYRLPTEIEYEYLASNGGITMYPWDYGHYRIRGHPTGHWGDSLLNFPVGTKRNHNKWGVYDLVGSLRFWCLDPYMDANTRHELFSKCEHANDIGCIFDNIYDFKTEKHFRVVKGGAYTLTGYRTKWLRLESPELMSAFERLYDEESIDKPFPVGVLLVRESSPNPELEAFLKRHAQIE